MAAEREPNPKPLPEGESGEVSQAIKQLKWLVIMVGIPGSGKTTFAGQLAGALGAYRLNMDLLRGELFQTANRQEQIEYNRTQTAGLSPPDQRAWHEEKNRQVSELFDKKLELHLSASQSVVVDASSDSRKQRDRLYRAAEQFGALPVVVWMQVPCKLAIDRATNRELKSDSYPFAKDHLAREEIDRCLARLDRPTDDEPVALVDGQDDIGQQLKAFANCAAGQLPQPPSERVAGGN